MPRVILPPDALKRLLRPRQASGADRGDEVWNGVYVLAPDADNVHEALRASFAYALRSALADPAVRILGGGNVSDRADDWTRNYRCPDVQVYFPDNPAEDRGTHYLGGPDFAIEVLSPGDRARQKLSFYARVGVRELLIVDRKPWRLELYRLSDGRLRRVGTARAESAEAIPSAVLPLSFRLTADLPRPKIEVFHLRDGRVWRL